VIYFPSPSISDVFSPNFQGKEDTNNEEELYLRLQQEEEEEFNVTRTATPEMISLIHLNHREWLRDNLSVISKEQEEEKEKKQEQEKEKYVVVVTHHLPSFHLLDNHSSQEEGLKWCYASDTIDYLRQSSSCSSSSPLLPSRFPTLWFHGHAHTKLVTRLDHHNDNNFPSTLFVRNPLGYPSERMKLRGGTSPTFTTVLINLEDGTTSVLPT
jgi:hypothetical protein